MRPAVLLMGALLAVACAQGAGVHNDDRAVTFQVQGEPEEIAVYRGLVDAFMKDHADIAVEIIEVSEEEDALAKLATAFAAGDPPDVFLINYREYSQFAARDAIEPIESHLAAAGIDIDDYYPEPVEAFTFAGRLQCLPQNVSSLVVYYNTELFASAGVARPQAGWDYNEFRDTAIALTGNGAHGLGIDAKIIRVAPFVWSGGGELLDDPAAPTRFTLQEPATRAALQFVIDLVREDGVVPDEQAQAGEDLETRFTTGKLAMFLGSRRDTPKFREVLDLRWDVAPLPVGKEPAGILHSDAYCISKDSKNIADALTFVSFALGEDGQALTAFSGRTVPSLRAVAESQAFLDPGQPPRRARVFLEGIPFVRRTPVIPTWPQIEDIANEIVARLFFEPGYTIDDAQRELDDQTRGLFREGTG